ncbi:MAG: cysteine--tRNA ligase, partial [Clostridia bacterium]|nr:cysteine--tRNA ligase [Clostridia bacterium]
NSTLATAYANQIRESYALLGFFKKQPAVYLAERKTEESIPAEVTAIAEERWQARLARDWAKSDELRDKLAGMGYAVKDSKTGYELVKNS